MYSRRLPLLLAARAINALFFLTTALYGILCAVPFAYHQFIEPRVWKWPSVFVENHHYLYWACLALTFTTVRRRGSRVVMVLQGAYALGAVLVGSHLLASPVLAAVEGTPRGLAIGCAALLFPSSLALIDFVAIAPVLAPQRFDRRLVSSSVVATLVIALTYAIVAGAELLVNGGSQVAKAYFAGAMIVSLLTHQSLFLLPVAAVALIATARGPLGSRPWAQYIALLAAVAAALTMLLVVHVLPALTFTGATGSLVSIAVAVTVTVAWASLAAAVACDGRRDPIEPVDLLIARRPAASTRRRAVVVPVVIVIVAGVLAGFAVSRVDWDFTVQGLIVAAVWCAAWAAVYKAWPCSTDKAVYAEPDALRGVNGQAVLSRRAWVVSLACAIGVLGSVATTLTSDRFPTAKLALDEYAQEDQSFRLITRVLASGTTGETTDFYRFLQANTNIAHVGASPIDVDFGRHAGALAATRPDIFLFVIDSLRPDYLGAYNAQATFTPAIDAFARESFVYRRAFTRYGATAMAVPSIWTGGMTLHMQYLQPYWPMNALEKLLAAGGYRKRMSVDPITARLMKDGAGIERLDNGRPVVDYRLCTTLAELQQRLGAERTDGRPQFVFTLPQDVHISTSLRTAVPVGESYPGFVPQVASQVHRIDGCFGEFIAFLKATHRYEHSIVILTADHGDSLGEGRRWGHAYTLYPEVVRVPLIIHAPDAEGLGTDTERLAFSADIVPTLYALLGATPDYLGPLYGSPLVTHGEPLRDRSRDQFMLVSSYGPVYGLLSDGGARYYISNAVTGRELAYDMADVASPREIPVSAAMRRASWRSIRESVETLGALYDVAAREQTPKRGLTPKSDPRSPDL